MLGKEDQEEGFAGAWKEFRYFCKAQLIYLKMHRKTSDLTKQERKPLKPWQNKEHHFRSCVVNKGTNTSRRISSSAPGTRAVQHTALYKQESQD